MVVGEGVANANGCIICGFEGNTYTREVRNGEVLVPIEKVYDWSRLGWEKGSGVYVRTVCDHSTMRECV